MSRALVGTSGPLARLSLIPLEAAAAPRLAVAQTRARALQRLVRPVRGVGLVRPGRARGAVPARAVRRAAPPSVPAGAQAAHEAAVPVAGAGVGAVRAARRAQQQQQQQTTHLSYGTANQLQSAPVSALGALSICLYMYRYHWMPPPPDAC
jgi:hypothetical protein